MKKLLSLVLTICLSSATFALDWQMVGARQMGMGGAGVAIAQGIDAQYYNPALLTTNAEYDDTEAGFTFGAVGQMKPLYENMDDLYHQHMTKLDANVGVGIKKGGFAFGIRTLSSLITVPFLSSYLLESHIKTDMGAFAEASLSYGFKLIEGIQLGANAKVIEGTMAGAGLKYGYVSNPQKWGFGGLMKETWYNKEFSTSWGVDLGAAINFSELFQGNFLFDPTIAIVGKNLNNPKFKRPKKPSSYSLQWTDWDASDYEMGRQFRIGAAIHPFTDRLTIAADYDLNENEAIVKDYKSRQLSAGVEFMAVNRHTFQVPIRVGINKNTANSDAPTYYTAGFGTRNTEYSFEMALTVGDRTEKVNGNDFPNVMGLTMSFAWVF